jgi:uroporphyrinogen decarboxylase
MESITGKQRIEAAVQRRRTDRIPYNIDVGPHYSSQIGYSTDKYFGDIDIAIECQVKAVEAYSSDLVTVPQNVPIWWSPKAVYRFKTKKEEVEPGILKDKEALADIENIPFEDCEALHNIIESCQKVSEFAARDYAIRMAAAGPMLDAAMLTGIEDWIVFTKEDPEYIHDLMRLTTDAVKGRIKKILDSTKVMILVVADPFASCSTISPTIYHEFVLPYEKDLCDWIKGQIKGETLIGLHICGLVDPIMKDIVNLGIDWVELDGPSSLKKMVEESQGKVIIRGNIGAEVFSEGTKEQIEEAVRECIEIGAGTNAYILSTGCQIPLNTPLENVNYFMEAAEKYGKFDQ